MTKLVYESYVPLALNTLQSIVTECRAHCLSTVDCGQLDRVAVVHLLGESPVGTASLVISVSSKHRKAAFVATEWILEQVKKRCQVWKREEYADSDGPAEWKENFPVINR